jgi:hypothetical protein
MSKVSISDKGVTRDGKPVTIEMVDKAAADFIGNYIGKRDDETLGDALERFANQPNGSEALFAKKDADK